MVVVAFEGMSFKKGSNYKALTGKMLVVAHEGSIILHSNYNWVRQKHDVLSGLKVLDSSLELER